MSDDAPTRDEQEESLRNVLALATGVSPQSIRFKFKDEEGQVPVFFTPDEWSFISANLEVLANELEASGKCSQGVPGGLSDLSKRIDRQVNAFPVVEVQA